MIDKKDRIGFASPYKAAYENGWDLKNQGYDYSKTLTNKILSSYMFGNPNVKKFLEEYFNPIIVNYINNVKYLRIFYNYAVPKDYQKID
jgi:hypothetical protein